MIQKARGLILKIGIVCYPSLGGSGVVATELGHQLAATGHEVHFITYELPFRLRLQENIFFHKVEIFQYDLFKYPDYALTLAVKIASVAAKYSLEILHVHYAIPHATSAYLARAILGTSKPVLITTLHGTDITLVGRDPSYFQVVKFSIEKSNGVTAVSQNLAEVTKEYFKIDKPIEVIYNFFIPKKELIGTKPLRDSFVTPQEKLLLHSSNYRSLKKPIDVLEIFRIVRTKIPCKMLFLGTGPEIEEVKHRVTSENLTSEVYFVGSSREVDPYVASADVFLLPSEQESFGLAALEAMAYGIPVVASRVGGLPELIENGRSGFLAPPGDTQTMASYVVSLLSDPDLYNKISSESRIRACEKFCTDTIISQYEVYYQRVLKSTLDYLA